MQSSLADGNHCQEMGGRFGRNGDMYVQRGPARWCRDSPSHHSHGGYECTHAAGKNSAALTGERTRPCPALCDDTAAVTRSPHLSTWRMVVLGQVCCKVVSLLYDPFVCSRARQDQAGREGGKVATKNGAFMCRTARLQCNSPCLSPNRLPWQGIICVVLSPLPKPLISL